VSKTPLFDIIKLLFIRTNNSWLLKYCKQMCVFSTVAVLKLYICDCSLEFGVYLAEFTVDTSVAVEVRQLASLLLKQYVEVHWSQHSDKFREPETTERVTY